MVEVKQTNGENLGSFDAFIDGNPAGLMTYKWGDSQKLIIDYTEVMPNYRSQGVGKEMVYSAVDYARKNNITILPLCPYANSIFQKNEEIQDVLA